MSGSLTKEEAIECYDVIAPSVLIIELDRPPEKFHASGGIATNIWKPTSIQKKQQNSALSGKVIKMYVFENDAEREDACSSHPKLKKIGMGSRVTFMDYAAPEGPFVNYPEIRVMSCDDVIGILKTDKPIVD